MIERDVKIIINIKDLDQFQRFLSLCATRIGQTIDYTSMSNDLGISRHTVKEWISILKASYIITTLPPYFKNLGKRIIKSSKLFFNDVGLAAFLLGINEMNQISQHPLRGNLFENFIVLEISKLLLNSGQESRLYFYRDSNQLEVDVVFQQGLYLNAVEIKSSKTFHKEFLKALTKFEQLAGKERVKKFLIYSGDHEQNVNHCQVLNYKNTPLIVQNARI